MDSHYYEKQAASLAAQVMQGHGRSGILGGGATQRGSIPAPPIERSTISGTTEESIDLVGKLNTMLYNMREQLCMPRPESGNKMAEAGDTSLLTRTQALRTSILNAIGTIQEIESAL